MWQDAVHQVGCLLVHAPARAGWAEPHLAGERNHAGATAGCALEPDKAVGQIAARRDGTELALDKVRQRALVVIAAGDEVIEVVPQEARESAGLRVPRRIGMRSPQPRKRGAGVMDGGGLNDAHGPPIGKRHAIPMGRSVGGSQALPSVLWLCQVSRVERPWDTSPRCCCREVMEVVLWARRGPLQGRGRKTNGPLTTLRGSEPEQAGSTQSPSRTPMGLKHAVLLALAVCLGPTQDRPWCLESACSWRSVTPSSL